MEVNQDVARQQLRRIAFIPAEDRDFIMRNYSIAHPPEFRLQFWKPPARLLQHIENPVMGLESSLKNSQNNNTKFTRSLYMASFRTLWHYKSDFLPSNIQLFENASFVKMTKTMWWRKESWKTLCHVVQLKCQLQNKKHVELYGFDGEFYDNPAIAALVAYKCDKRFNYADISCKDQQTDRHIHTNHPYGNRVHLARGGSGLPAWVA
ncbi:hypothetical protein BGZ98_010105 [Dissophora globulifera]|nr:hypothetical protein BGZ98_010105 [Dissophora globulifera]